MKTIKPNYKDLGYADTMGHKLRSLVEQQLSADLKNYGIDKKVLKFDWAESCIEGHQTFWLDGSVENFSGIGVFDDDNFVAGGWMEFVDDKETNFFIAYWEFVRTYQGDNVIATKNDVGIPEHIWNKMPENLKPIWHAHKRTMRKLP